MAVKGKMVVNLVVVVLGSALCHGFEKRTNTRIMTPDNTANQNAGSNNMFGYITTASAIPAIQPSNPEPSFTTPTDDDDTVVIEVPDNSVPATGTVEFTSSTLLTTTASEAPPATASDAPATSPESEASAEGPTTLSTAASSEATTQQAIVASSGATTQAIVASSEATTQAIVAFSGATTQAIVASSEATTQAMVASSEATINATHIGDLFSSLVTIMNASFTGPIFGIEFPKSIKISLDINGSPNITVNVVKKEEPTTEDVPIVEIIRVNASEIDNQILVVTEIAESTLNIDLSGPEWSPMTTTTTTTTTPTTTTTIAASMKNIYQEKCTEYYDVGKRTKRRTKVQVLIVGGTNSNPREFPHMAAMGYGKKTDGKFLCGGSLISENYVITAAHCLTANNIGDIQFVRLGTTNLQTETLNSHDYNVIRRIPHPDYVAGQQYNDIALVQLDRSVDFSEYVAPICLYGDESNVEFLNTKLTATGWGRTQAAGSVSPELQKVELDYFTYWQCQQSYSTVSKEQLPQGIKEDSQLCAGSFDGQRDTCQGDSGGPLQLQKDGRLYLVGITSFGVGCGKPGAPGVYTKIAHYVPWIQGVVWGQ